MWARSPWQWNTHRSCLMPSIEFAVMIDTMSAEACAAVAQVVPVFLIALIAERVRAPKSNVLERRRPLVRLAVILRALGRVVVDVSLAVIMVVLEITVLLGIDTDGLGGKTAQQTWALLILVIAVTLLRWLFLNPAIQLLAVEYWRFAGFVAEWLFRAIAYLAELLAKVLVGGPDFIAKGLERVADGTTRLILRLTAPAPVADDDEGASRR